MDFNHSDEQRMLVEAARRYVRERCNLEARRALARTADGFSRERWAEFGEMGWLALPLPEDKGGLGGTAADVALLMEELGRGLVIEPLVDSVVLCGRLLSHGQASAAAGPLLERLATGEVVLALAHVEGGARNDYQASVETRASRTERGWLLQGAKTRVHHGDAASHWLVTARIDDQAGFGLFLVDSATLPRTVHPLIDGSRVADLRFDDLPLGPDALLLAADAAPAALHDALDHAVLALAASAIGSMEAVMAMTADYLKTRVQYGQPLAAFQALRHRMSEMFVETDQSRAALYRALAAVEAGDATAQRRAVSAAKWLIARAGLFVCGQGIQLHGGIGTTEEYAVGHHYKALVSFDKRLGDADFHLQRSSSLFESA